MMRVKFWGVRGSIPVPGPDTVRVGGNTLCVEVVTPGGEVLVLDAGTGVRDLGLDLGRRSNPPPPVVVLLSHTHWDHIQGFPFFAPTRRPDQRITVVGQRRPGQALRQILSAQMSGPFLPFGLDDLAAEITVQEVEDGQEITLGDGTTILARRLSHPGGVLGYRVTCGGKTVVYATDVGHPQTGLDAALVALARGADLLIHDAIFARTKTGACRLGPQHWLERSAGGAGGGRPQSGAVPPRAWAHRR
jgi:phosphoribosyl 1,2-cyclic phosphodiesterase